CPKLTNRHFPLGLVLQQDLRCRRILEGRLTDQHVIKCAAEAVEIGANVAGLGVVGLLRSPVICVCPSRFQRRHGYVKNLKCLPWLCYHEIRWPNVSMDHASLVDDLESKGSLPDKLTCLGDGKRPRLLDELGKVGSLDKVGYQHV